MFGGVPDNTAYHFPYPSHQGLQNSSSFYPRAPRPPSPTLVEQRLLREQQVWFLSDGRLVPTLVSQHLLM